MEAAVAAMAAVVNFIVAVGRFGLVVVVVVVVKKVLEC